MSDISKQDETYICLAQLEAEKSPCKNQHGSVAVCSGKIIATGFNEYRNRTKTSDGHSEEGYTCHAEMSAIRNIYKTFSNHKRIDKIFSRTKLYITRVSNNNYEYKESSPCSDCLLVIKRLNIKKLIYTTSSCIKIVNDVNRYENNHKSSARRYMMRQK